MDHFFYIQWFGQMCVHTTVQCMAYILCKSISGQCDDGNGRSIRPVKLPDLACGLVSVHQRHHNIHKYHIKCPLGVTGEKFYSFPAIGYCSYHSTFLFKEYLCHFSVYFIILCQQDLYALNGVSLRFWLRRDIRFFCLFKWQSDHKSTSDTRSTGNLNGTTHLFK